MATIGLILIIVGGACGVLGLLRVRPDVNWACLGLVLVALGLLVPAVR